MKVRGTDLRDLLQFFLKDPLLWEKMRLLRAEKYTKTYQRDGLDLVMVKFYPFAEDWCELSALSNGSGFSRCYIFVYLLEYYLGLRELTGGVTNPVKRLTKRFLSIYCTVKVSRITHKLERNLKIRRTNTKQPLLVNQITLKSPSH